MARVAVATRNPTVRNGHKPYVGFGTAKNSASDTGISVMNTNATAPITIAGRLRPFTAM